MSTYNPKEEILNLIIAHPKHYGRIIRKNYPKLLEFIEKNIEGTPIENDPNIDFTTKVYWAVYGLKEFPVCKICGKSLRKKIVQNFFFGYAKYCGPSCQNKDPKVKNAIKKTCIEKYGVDSYAKTEAGRKSRRDRWIGYIPKEKHIQRLTHEERCAIQKKNREKYKKTMMERYGVENSGQLQQQKEGIKRFMSNTIKVENARKKMIETIKNNYGVENPSQSYEIHKKQIAKYTYDNRKFDSSAEIAFYIWLKENNIEFEYCPNVKIFYTFKDKQYRYFPDFIVNGKLVEIKGDHFFKEDGTMQCPFKRKEWSEKIKMELDEKYEAKHQCMLQNEVIIIKYSEMKKYFDYIYKKYGRNYLKQFKRK